MKIAITGASGFIGRALTSHLVGLGHEVTALVRQSLEAGGVNNRLIEDITRVSASHVEGQQVVVHLAGVAHDVTADRGVYQRVNVIGTEAVTRACVQAGVGRLIFLSSVKVHGDASSEPLNAGSRLYPADDYGRSKIDAERIVLAQTILDPMVVRVPLVYGKGVKGNFAALVKLVRTGLPLPFKSIAARRSYLGIDNLVDLLASCAESAGTGSRVLYGADPSSLRLPEMLEAIGLAVGRRVTLLPFPAGVLRVVTSALIGTRRADKLFSQLEVDLSGTLRHAGWAPPYTTQASLQRMFGHPDQPC